MPRKLLYLSSIQRMRDTVKHGIAPLSYLVAKHVFHMEEPEARLAESLSASAVLGLSTMFWYKEERQLMQQSCEEALKAETGKDKVSLRDFLDSENVIIRAEAKDLVKFRNIRLATNVLQSGIDATLYADTRVTRGEDGFERRLTRDEFNKLPEAERAGKIVGKGHGEYTYDQFNALPADERGGKTVGGGGLARGYEKLEDGTPFGEFHATWASMGAYWMFETFDRKSPHYEVASILEKLETRADVGFSDVLNVMQRTRVEAGKPMLDDAEKEVVRPLLTYIATLCNTPFEAIGADGKRAPSKVTDPLGVEHALIEDFNVPQLVYLIGNQKIRMHDEKGTLLPPDEILRRGTSEINCVACELGLSGIRKRTARSGFALTEEQAAAMVPASPGVPPIMADAPVDRSLLSAFQASVGSVMERLGVGA